MSQQVRVRFAPSPTGPLHIGGLRTALFNYLFAHNKGGKFLLRIEDTDQNRYVEGAEKYIVDSLLWCGLIPDEGHGFGGEYGPYRQSERREIYEKYAQILLDKGAAYYAFDSSEDLEEKRKEGDRSKVPFMYSAATRLNGLKNSLVMNNDEVSKLIQEGLPYVIRFKMPETPGNISINDEVRGAVIYNTKELDDKVLFKSDGLPTYHLANVVDDYLMKISHVIRGEEWLPSTPLHVLLYRAFGWEDRMPQFAHLPLIMKPEGKGKLSKRDGDKMGFPVFPLLWKDPKTGEESRGYREDGYFPEAVANMLALLGWNSGTEQEIYSLKDLERIFTLDRVGKSGAKFDPSKTLWFNQQYMKLKGSDELVQSLSELLHEKNILTNINLERVISLVKDRATFFADLWTQSSFFFVAPVSYDEKVLKKYWNDGVVDKLDQFAQLLKNLEAFLSENIETTTKSWIQEKEYSIGVIMNLIRLALVGESKGPHLFDIIELIGKNETIKRINTLINYGQSSL